MRQLVSEVAGGKKIQLTCTFWPEHFFPANPFTPKTIRSWWNLTQIQHGSWLATFQITSSYDHLDPRPPHWKLGKWTPSKLLGKEPINWVNWIIFWHFLGPYSLTTPCKIFNSSKIAGTSTLFDFSRRSSMNMKIGKYVNWIKMKMSAKLQIHHATWRKYLPFSEKT